MDFANEEAIILARRRSRRRYGPIVTIITIILALLTSLFYYLDVEMNLFGRHNVEPLDGKIEIHIIDVGQGDSILIKTPDGHVLIDGGPGSAEDDLRRYLKAEGVEEIEYFFCTHPDEDHIGGADMVINEFDVKNVVLTSHISTTATYERLLTAIENSSANRILSKLDAEYEVGDLKLKTIAPIGSMSSNNNSSIVLRAQYGANVAIFTGDADIDSEEEILDAYSAADLRCDLLKIGHHGSHTSTSEAWLNALRPKLAAISCGKDNKYGHPHDEIVERLNKHKVTFYQTDLEGSIVFVSDGATIQKEG